MPTTPAPSQWLAAAVTGVATTAYYATPDLIRSRTRRGWAKAGLSAVVVAGSVADVRRSLAEVRAERAADGEADAEPVDWQEAVAAMSPRAKVVAGTVAVGSLGLSVLSVVVAERWIFRRGERRRAAGVSWPHSRAALALGVGSAVLSLVPPAKPVDPAPR